MEFLIMGNIFFKYSSSIWEFTVKTDFKNQVNKPIEFFFFLIKYFWGKTYRIRFHTLIVKKILRLDFMVFDKMVRRKILERIFGNFQMNNVTVFDMNKDISIV